MEDLKYISLKDLLFYLLKSWRQILASILIFALLALGITKFTPVKMVPEEKLVKVPVFPNGVIQPLPREAASLDYSENPEERYSPAELEQELTLFKSSNQQAQKYIIAIDNLEMDNISLEEMLIEYPLFQIDPNNRINLQLVVEVCLSEEADLDKNGKIFMEEQLVRSYLFALQDNEYYNSIATESNIGYTGEEVKRLVKVNIKSPTTLIIKVTAPDNDTRQLLLKTAKEEIVRLYEDGKLSSISHSFNIKDLEAEVVKDHSLANEKISVQQRIEDNKEKIAKYEEAIYTLFLANYKNVIESGKAKIERGKEEARLLLIDELEKANATKEQIKLISLTLEKGNWDAVGIQNLGNNLFRAIDHDRMVAFQNPNKKVMKEETAFNYYLSLLSKDQQVESNRQVKLVAQPKQYKRNLALGIFLGLIIGGLYTLLKYWNKLDVYNIRMVAEMEEIPFLGHVTFISEEKKAWLLPEIDMFFWKLLGKDFDKTEQEKEIEIIRQYLYMHYREAGEKIRVIVPGVKGNKDKTVLLDLFTEGVSQEEVELVGVSDLLEDPKTLEQMNKEDLFLLLMNGNDPSKSITETPRLIKNNNKQIIGAIEIQERWA